MPDNILLRDARCPKCDMSLSDDYYLINRQGMSSPMMKGGYPTIQLKAEWNGNLLEVRTSAVYGVRATHGLAEVPMNTVVVIQCPGCAFDMSKNAKFDPEKEKSPLNMERVGLCRCGAPLFELKGVYTDPPHGMKHAMIRACTRWGCHEHELVNRESADRTPLTPSGRESQAPSGLMAM